MSKKKTDEEKKRLIKSSNRLSYGAGFVSGLGGLGKSRAGAALKTTASVMGLGSSVQNWRGSSNFGEFVSREFGNMGRILVGFGAGFGSVAALKSKKVRSAASSAGAKTAGGTAKVRKFVRINGRVIPIRGSKP